MVQSIGVIDGCSLGCDCPAENKVYVGAGYDSTRGIEYCSAPNAYFHTYQDGHIVYYTAARGTWYRAEEDGQLVWKWQAFVDCDKVDEDEYACYYESQCFRAINYSGDPPARHGYPWGGPPYVFLKANVVMYKSLQQPEIDIRWYVQNQAEPPCDENALDSVWSSYSEGTPLQCAIYWGHLESDDERVACYQAWRKAPWY